MNRHLASAIWDAAYAAAHVAETAKLHERLPGYPLSLECATSAAVAAADRAVACAVKLEAFAPRPEPAAVPITTYQRERAVEALLVREPHLTRMEAERQVMGGHG